MEPELSLGSRDTTVRSGMHNCLQLESPQGTADLSKSVAFSPDGTRIVADSRDNTLRIMHPTTGISVEKLINSSHHPFDPIASMSLFSTTIGGNGTFQSTNQLGQVSFQVFCTIHIRRFPPIGWIRFPNIPFPLLWVPLLSVSYFGPTNNLYYLKRGIYRVVI
ncbi:hypothetical protein D9757_011891 [Collybiopsis confluens]|uniref:Uncharacterized protein n=1 Tax=Collybiopsis confluens TaxID=2823264 RepID=A0A8H5GKF3_9AGAR|nr:hypothetical protein D9757_011891 [Collybiopsis confluens]